MAERHSKCLWVFGIPKSREKETSQWEGRGNGI